MALRWSAEICAYCVLQTLRSSGAEEWICWICQSIRSSLGLRFAGFVNPAGAAWGLDLLDLSIHQEQPGGLDLLDLSIHQEQPGGLDLLDLSIQQEQPGGLDLLDLSIQQEQPGGLDLLICQSSRSGLGA